jgi:protein-S-isoprenylcysteine O-methyltransferase Ste14
MGETVFSYVLVTWIIVAIPVFISLFFISAPYGRYFRRSFGPAINGKLGWILMEAPAPLLFAAFFISGMRTVNIAQIIFLAMWEFHYVDRSFLYPLTIRISSKPFPLAVLIAGLAFNIMNAYLNSNYILMNTPKYAELWLYDMRFLAGLGLFFVGFIVNRHSDYILHLTRRTWKQEYGIPQGGFYRWISCPNYLGEIVIWIGWTVATWSPVAAAFSFWTIANLVPRARSHHQWYRQHFADYPDKRRVLVPGIW